MRFYKTEKKLTEYTDCVKLTCDICNSQSPTNSNDWDKDMYVIKQIEIKYKTGSCYPSHGLGVEYVIDMCPKCFKEKLIPFIESFNRVQIKEKTWDY